MFLHNRCRNNNQKGFTMLELLMVIIVIGILASLGIPSYEMFMERAKRAEATTSVSAIRTAVVNELAKGRTPAQMCSDYGKAIVEDLGLKYDLLTCSRTDVLWGYFICPYGPVSHGENYVIVACRENKNRPAIAFSALIYYYKDNNFITQEEY
ncbi:MAG: prepilin-type N-terminal cleavage/methylation domain-containing protein [Candidatus Omnitrophica bacterium]|nr:prepilin-type N-terminal cleavage/methylation domain-containing protein [Candidatus Omnitrophota bacterium]